MDGVIHESDVHVRADNTAERRVPFPASWKSELNIGATESTVDAEVLAHAAAQRARELLSLTNATKLDCRQSSQAYMHTYEHKHGHAYSSTVIYHESRFVGEGGEVAARFFAVLGRVK